MNHRAWLLWLLSAATMCCWVQTAVADEHRSARQLVDECRSNAPEGTEGVEAFEKVCPGLTAALEELGSGGQLCRDCRDGLSFNALDDLLALHDRYAAEAQAPLPNTAHLETVLNDIGKGPEHSLSWWDRVKNWLRDITRKQSGSMPSWLDGLIERLSWPELLMKVVVYTLIGVLVILALIVIVNEMRAAGLFARWGVMPRSAASGAHMLVKERQGELTLADIDAAAAIERPGLMLRLVAGVLRKNRQLPAERNLTHRELARMAQLSNALDRERLQRLALLAESIRYGKQAAAQDTLGEQIHGVVADARGLYSELTHTQVSSTSASAMHA